MTEKELRRLNRMQLLEMLVEQTRRADELEAQLKETQKQLEDRRLLCEEAGNIAKASLEINKVFEACQQAADQYLENIRILAEEKGVRTSADDSAEVSAEGETEDDREDSAPSEDLQSEDGTEPDSEKEDVNQESTQEEADGAGKKE